PEMSNAIGQVQGRFFQPPGFSTGKRWVTAGVKCGRPLDDASDRNPKASYIAYSDDIRDKGERHLSKSGLGSILLFHSTHP
ncbi:hypothetical protein, partial [Methylobacterium radiotolerans]|uniref:hypothetical protein n=1 Tax=Methylobacterium radiotolerans TaxID=31998 RepID=UPI001AEE03BC